MSTFNFQGTDIHAVIFDMDGLLIDSEPYWKIAEKEVFGRHGLDLTDDLLRQVMGFRLSEAVDHWYRYQPWPDPDLKQTESDIIAVMHRLISTQAKAMPGVYDLLKMLKSKGIRMALASSSVMSLILLVLERLDIKEYFEVVHSAEFESYGKPHPAIFLSTATSLKVSPLHCLVFEDSVNGVLAAKAARMKCVAVPELATMNDPRFAIADLKINSLERFIV